jgi:hypothetical protein
MDMANWALISRPIVESARKSFFITLNWPGLMRDPIRRDRGQSGKPSITCCTAAFVSLLIRYLQVHPPGNSVCTWQSSDSHNAFHSRQQRSSSRPSWAWIRVICHKANSRGRLHTSALRMEISIYVYPTFKWDGHLRMNRYLNIRRIENCKSVFQFERG